jgi:hypothetical protein
MRSMHRICTTLLPIAAAATFALTGTAHAFSPANDDLSGAVDIGALKAVAGQPTLFESADIPYETGGASTEPGEAKHPDGAGKTVWFKWKAAAAGGVFANACGAPTNQTVRVFRHISGQVTPATLTPAAEGQLFVPAASFCKSTWRAEKGHTYYIQLDTTGSPIQWDFVVSQQTAPPAAPKIAAGWPATTGVMFASKFVVNPDASQHICAVTGSPYQPCVPGQIRVAAHGPATFWARAVDAWGNLSATASKTWQIDGHAPQIQVQTGPPQLTFTTDEPATTQCRIDGGAWKACTSGQTGADALGAGAHQIELRSADAFGNIATLAPLTWTVPGPAGPATAGTTATATAPLAGTPAAPTPATQAVRSSAAATSATPSCVATAKLPAKLKLAKARKGVKVAGCAVTYRQHGKRLRSAKAAKRGSLQVIVAKGAEQRTLKLRVV